MAIRIAVVDMTGSGHPPAHITLEAGRCRFTDLRRMSLNALELADSKHARLEARTATGIATLKLETGCTVFVFGKEPSIFDGIFDGADGIFRDLFGGGRRT